ncbi:MAG: D-alanine--D-alanine ligase [Clostridia bacterium]|nr:D-alanine--D-alanine ligase [Clostridia bacterium]
MKIKVLVLFGGVSSEHDISLISASSVITNIPADKYDVRMMGISKEGICYLYTGDPANLPSDKWLEDTENLERCVISPDRGHHGIIHLDSCEVERIDVVFPVLHGKNGEDGTIQGLLELSGIPFVGCRTASSAVCMDKAMTNAVCDFAGIAQAKWKSFNRCDYRFDRKELLDEAESALGFPIFVKPANAGSSVGISKVFERSSLEKACELAFKHDDKIVLEESIDGDEVECAVLGNDEPIASVVGEIVPVNDFYDFDAKYADGTTALYIPARLSDEKSEEIRKQAIKVFKALDCSGFSRVDFFVRHSDGAVLLNEVNTIPGFTSISMYPKLFEASGVSFPELTDRLCRLPAEYR